MEWGWTEKENQARAVLAAADLALGSRHTSQPWELQAR